MPRRMPLIAALVLALLVVFGIAAYSYASPYLVLDRLKRAADARDAETVSRYVDYPSLRTSLKQQVTDLLARRIETQKREHPFAALGALVGIALIGPLVDAYATPDGVAALLNGIPPHGDPGEAPPPPGQGGDVTAGGNPPAQGENAAPGQSTVTPEPKPPRASAGYRSIDTFAVTYRRDDQSEPYSVLFQRSGWFDWKLAAVDLGRRN
ncbi:DUF2939 domain-containing protein [Trinickia caryophylli]|nr:DUF2939 domain-containing protein [Trinickia caryophylli]PMS11843.1 DUF2939 domain-containing protein [Trinickia caryophylli]TRX20189.1 DUF2939 domain-containing protein [Trinickia caryophylli]